MPLMIPNLRIELQTLPPNLHVEMCWNAILCLFLQFLIAHLLFDQLEIVLQFTPWAKWFFKTSSTIP